MPKDINLMIQGYKKFKKEYYGKKYSTFSELIENGQKPKVLIIACSDSRVDPAIILNAQPGDLFVIRNVANLVPPYEEDNGYHGTSAALEFGVCVLGIRHIVVFGHSQCGGISKLVENSENKPQEKNFVNKWIELARPAYDQTFVKHEELSFAKKSMLCGQYSLLNSLNNLKTFPWIEERMKQSCLFLHAWYFDLLSGSINVFDGEKENFVELENSLVFG